MIVALVPAYNAQHTIAEVVIRTKKRVAEVLVFDDGSKDYTGEIARQCGARVTSSFPNRGRGYALRSLFCEVNEMNPRPDIVVTIDADMQHNPDDIPRLVKPILEGRAEMVIGIRRNQKRFRSIVNKFLDTLAKRKETQSGYRAYSCTLFDRLCSISAEGFGADTEISYMSKGVSTEYVPVNVRYDQYSHTKNPVLHFLELLEYIISSNPLIYLCLPAIMIFSSSLYGFIWVSNWWLQYHELAVGTLLLSMTAMVLSVITFFTGVILRVLNKQKG